MPKVRRVLAVPRAAARGLAAGARAVGGPLLGSALAAVGYAATVVGLALVAVPLALVVGGVALVALGALVERGRMGGES